MFEKLHLPSIIIAAATLVGLPLAWTITARNEYKNKTIQRAVGSANTGAYLLAFLIFTISLVRDYAFIQAVRLNPSPAIISPNSGCSLLQRFGGPAAWIRGLSGLAGACSVVGMTLVTSSFLRLGIKGTYLGDYFGFLKDKRVTAFPFNVLDHPMYVGGSLNFTSIALQGNSLVGLALAGLSAITYTVVEAFEGPFTAKIYANRNSAPATTTEKKKK